MKKVLKCNCYKNRAMKIPSKKEAKKDLNVTQKDRKRTSSVGIPYIYRSIRTASANFQETCVSMYHKPTNKLREIRLTSETEGQNTHGTTIGGGIPTEM